MDGKTLNHSGVHLASPMTVPSFALLESHRGTRRLTYKGMQVGSVCLRAQKPEKERQTPTGNTVGEKRRSSDPVICWP